MLVYYSANICLQLQKLRKMVSKLENYLITTSSPKVSGFWKKKLAHSVTGTAANNLAKSPF